MAKKKFSKVVESHPLPATQSPEPISVQAFIDGTHGAEMVVESTKGKRSAQVDAKRFCEAWKLAFDTGKDISWVADALGMELPSCRARASQIRAKLEEAGKKTLPTLVHAKRGKTPLDLDALADIFG